MRDLNIPWADIQVMNYFEFIEYINILTEEAKQKKEDNNKQEQEYEARAKHNSMIEQYNSFAQSVNNSNSGSNSSFSLPSMSDFTL